MKLYLPGSPGRTRSLVALTARWCFALAVILGLVGVGVSRLGHDWHQWDPLQAVNRAGQSEAAVERQKLSWPINPGFRAGSLRPTVRAVAASGMNGTGANDAQPPGAGSDHDPSVVSTSDDDAELCAALEHLERQMAAAIARARESVVALEYTAPDAPPGTRRVATGVVINPRGEVLSVNIDPPPALTNSATTRNSSRIVALDSSGRRHAVHWVAADPETGLTLLRLAPRAVQPIRSASGAPNLGSQTFVVGNPFGMGHSVSRGHIAGLDRALELGDRQLGGLIQIQAPLYPGDSGAAVVNLHGDWLGLIRSGLATPHSDSEAGPSGLQPSTLSPSGFSPSLTPSNVSLGRPERDTDFGFAIPARDALWVADQLRAGGRVDRAYLGVRLEPVPPTGILAASNTQQKPEAVGATLNSVSLPAEIEPRSKDPEAAGIAVGEGAIVREVLSGTPASQTGLRPGDCIIELDRQPIRSTYDLIDRLDRIPARVTIILGIVRNHGPKRQRISLSLCTASRLDAPQIASPGLPATAPTTNSQKEAGSTSMGFSSPPANDIAPRRAKLESQTNGSVALPGPLPDDLRLTLPRAVVERLEKLERRLEKLESFPPHATGSPSSPDPQISSTRRP
jgi:serine protease Do